MGDMKYLTPKRRLTTRHYRGRSALVLFPALLCWLLTCGSRSLADDATIAASDNARPAKPNIVWIVTEDMGPELACYGHPEVFTPTLDALAAAGVRYANAFTVTPVCSTSRSSFMTGMHACSIGAHQHRTPEERKQMLPAGVRVLTGWLKDAGYTTANIRGLIPPVENADADRDQPLEVKATGKTDWNFKFPREDDFAHHDWSQLKEHQPFYAQVNFSESHRGWLAPVRANPAKVKLPPYYPDHPIARNDWARYLDDISLVDAKVARVLAGLEADGLADNTIVVFMGDHGRAHVRGKQWCYDSGLRVPLIVRWAKNFGPPAGFMPGTVDERLIAAIDVSATTLTAMAGVAKPAQMQGRVFLGEEREADRQYTFATRDRCDMTTFHIRTVRDKRFRYIRNGMPEMPFMQWNAYKFRVYPMIPLLHQLHAEGKLNAVQAVLMADQRPSEELYDLVADPYEVNNLAALPTQAGKLAELRGVLDRWIAEVGDQGRESDSVRAPYDEMVRTRKDTRRKNRVRSKPKSGR